MLPVLLGLGVLFAVLFAARLAGARRAHLTARWPALVLAGAAVLLLRGGGRIGLALAGLAAAWWFFGPRLLKLLRPAVASGDPTEAPARAILGVGPNASEGEIRAAYREKIARAHPDRGGAHRDAARLTEARDQLLKKKR